MSTKVRKTRYESYRVTWDKDDGEEREFEVSFEPNEYQDILVEELPDGRVVVGYVSDDTDTRSPLDDMDGSGKIYHKNGQYAGLFREAMAIDSYGYTYDNSEPNEFAVSLSYIDQSYGMYRTLSFAAEDEEERNNADAVWVPDDSCLEHIQSSAIVRCVPGVDVSYKSKYNKDGTVITLLDGTPNPRYFNNITYTLADGRSRGGYKSFTKAAEAAARKLGVRIRQKDLSAKMREIAMECADQAIETVNTVLRGEVFGVCVDTIGVDGEIEEADACWGHIGESWGKEALADEFRRTVKHLREEIEKGPAVPEPERPRIRRRLDASLIAKLSASK